MTFFRGGTRGGALALVCVLGACHRSAPGDAPPARVELTYWPAANPREVALASELAARYETLHPDVHVRVQPIPAGRSSEEVLLAAIVAHATPDICSNVSSSLLARLVRARGVVRLDTLAPTAERLSERTTEPMLESLRLPDGGIYALPWKANPLMLMYNVDALAAAKVTPPRTYGELDLAFRQLARDEDGDGRLDHFAMWAPLKTTWFERFYDFYPLYLAASGGKTLLQRGEVTFDNDAAAGAIDVLRRGFSAGLLPRANFAGRDPFIDGTVAMKIIGPWFLEELARMQAPVRFDVVPIPVPDNAAPETAYAFADVKSIAVFSTSRHPEEAARFVAYLASVDADRTLIERTAQLPYRHGVAEDARFAGALARWPRLSKYAVRLERMRDVDPDPDVAEVFDILSEAYEAAAIYDTVPTRSALRDAASEARAVLHAR